MSVARLLLFVAAMLVLLGGVNWQVLRWARLALGLQPRAVRSLKLALGLLLIGSLLGRVAGRLWPSAITTGAIAATSVVELAVVITGSLLLLADVPRLVWKLVHARPARQEPVPVRAPEHATLAAAQPASTLPRRAVLSQMAAGSAFLIGGSSSLYGALKGRHDYRLEEVSFKLPGLGGLDGFSIAQLSDIHIGAFVGEPELKAAEELLRRARADLIVLTGDLLDSDVRLAPELARFVRRLTPLARHGVVAIPGNHDYFAGVSETLAAVAAAGGRVLQNDATIIGESGAGFALLGVDDVWGRREGAGPDLARAELALPVLRGSVAKARDLPRVLLCHNPSFFSEAAGRVALQLSGHTHGGQVNLGLRPADYVLAGGWVAGRYELNGSALYVNRGFGTVGPPARLGAPPEVTRIVLTA